MIRRSLAFLGLIEKGIAAGRNIRDLPAAAMRRAMKEVRGNLDEKLAA